MRTSTRECGVTLFNAIFFGVAGIFILVVTLPVLLTGRIEPSVGSIGFSLGGLVTLGASAYFFWAYRQDKRFEKEQEEDEARAFANGQETKTPAEANRR